MNSLFIQALLVGLLVWVLFIDKYVTQLFSYRPIVVGPLVGLLLGNVQAGLQVGVIVELMFLGQVYVGTALPPEETFSTAIAAAFACITGNVAVAVATALPLAILGQQVLQFRNMVLTVWTGNKVEKAALNLDMKGVWFYGQIMPNLFNLVLLAVPAFMAVYFGADAVQAIINAIPPMIISGLTVGGKIIGAVGLALLLKSINVKGVWYFFLIGFFFASYLNIQPIGIALIAVIAVAAAYYNDQRSESRGA